jgi:hypothetical protein
MDFIDTFNKNVLETDRLVEIHTQLTGGGSGYRANVEVLNKSGVVLLVACWEAFIEDLASHSFEFLLNHSGNHNTFPAKVLTRASKSFWDSKDERGVWSLAGSGWKAVLQSHKDNILKDFLGNFNTPRATQIDEMFESLVGFSNLSSNWSWQGMRSTQAKKKLSELITLRGAIAHRVSASRSVTKRDVIANGVFITRLAITSGNTLRNYIHRRTGKYPWTKGFYLP